MMTRTLLRNKGVTVSMEVVTPPLARRILANNPKNRKLNNATVENYRREMLRNRWKENGEPIKIAMNGRLMDGQHRLNALCKANMAVPMMIVRGLDESCFDTLDAGKSGPQLTSSVFRGEVDCYSCSCIKDHIEVSQWRASSKYERAGHRDSGPVGFSS